MSAMDRFMKGKEWLSALGGMFGKAEAQPARLRFTPEELRNLYEVLAKNPTVHEGNRALVVETIRAIAEFMIWGDQNEPRIFEFFLENNVMLYLHTVLQQPSNRSGDVAKQVLQTLSIIVQNVRSETGIFFLFSNNHINNIVGISFDFNDEEVLGFYITFLKVRMSGERALRNVMRTRAVHAWAHVCAQWTPRPRRRRQLGGPAANGQMERQGLGAGQA